MKEKFLQAIQELRKDLKEKRNISYSEGAVGITSLLYCPLKVEYRDKYPELDNESNAIDDGYIFENTIEPYLKKVFEGEFFKDPTIPYEIDGFKIEGHPDFIINQNDRIISIELKAPIMLRHSLSEIPENEFIFDEEDKVFLPETYVLQAKVQKFILQEHFKKPVFQYLFIKSMLKIKGKYQKVYVIKKIRNQINKDELRVLIKQFKKNLAPRYSWECRYCSFSKVCTSVPMEHLNQI